ncbi:tetratricopeptide repeat protein [Geovibrio ferrireducens]|uniref:tetratricopeptide repeat protein n=1 Tax=Geovibrio ferrireducens TaxID=46201 RepID=UPI0022479F93|nr:NB-ARC domain-containing protein [Geovibrio ferrireducens]
MEKVIRPSDIGYTIISRFESTLRDFLSNKLLILYGDTYLLGIPSGIQEKTNKRINTEVIESVNEFLEFTDFIDLREIILFKSLFRYYFDTDKITLNDFCIMMDELYELRCKIMHSRGLLTSINIDNLYTHTKEIAHALNDFGKEYLSFLEKFEKIPAEYILPIPDAINLNKETKKYSIPNNLPTPDYEYDGGFVGREDDIKKISKLLLGDLHNVITITGAGGVGKTALALRIVQIILNGNPTKFEGMVWLSAKEDKLSVVGIEDIEPTIKSYEELLDTILDVMGFEHQDSTIEHKELDVKTIFEISSNFLIVIDNLETINDAEIINFILDAPQNIKILITSRRGLGQVERRYELNQLREREAVALFRQLAIEKNLLDLAKIQDDTIKMYVKKVACYPLAIKWVIGHVALGKDINYMFEQVNSEKSDISLFCFDNIYKSLEECSKRLLCTLSCYDTPLAAGVIQYVANVTTEEFEDSIRDLILVSLIIQEQTKSDEGEIKTRYNLLSLTRGFVRNQLDRNTSLKKEFEDRMKTVQNTIEEAERAKKQYKFSLHNFGAITDEEKIATLIAQTAYQKYQSGRYDESIDDYKRAIEIAPRFASIYRNWAVMESTEGHSLEADKLIKKATDLNPSDPQIWLIKGNIKRKEGKIKEALEAYTKAMELIPNDYVIINAIGNCKSRLGEYEEADTLFKKALMIEKKELSTSNKQEVINRTSIAENLKRWAEAFSRERDYKNAQNKLSSAFEECQKALVIDENDQRTKILFKQVQLDLAYVYKKIDLNSAIKIFENIVVETPKKVAEIKIVLSAYKELITIYVNNSNSDKALKFAQGFYKISHFAENDLRKKIKSLLDGLQDNTSRKGKIIHVSCEKGYCIIESSVAKGDTYLAHIYDFLEQPNYLDGSYLNKDVSFIPSNIKDKKKAKRIAIT